MKKNLIFIIFILFTIFSCKPKEEKEKGIFTVKGNFKNSGGEIVTLFHRTPFEFIPLDSAKVNENGDFELKAYSEQKDFYVINAGSDYDVILLIDTTENIEITADINNIALTYKVKGSKECEKIQQLEYSLAYTKKVTDSLSVIYNEHFGLPGFDTIKAQLDSVFYPVLQKQKEFSRNFVTENLNSLVNLIAISQYLTPNAPIFDKEEDAEYYFMVDSALTKKFPESAHVKKLNGIVATMKKNVEDNLTPAGNITIGCEAPYFKLANQFGDTISLDDVSGKYVLIQFWATWCTPCMADNDNLKKLFWANFPKLQMIQISLDKDFEKWKTAIKDEELSWYHGCDFQIWNSKVVKDYGVKSLPANFLIDKQGKIIAKDLYGIDLENKLKEILKK